MDLTFVITQTRATIQTRVSFKSISDAEFKLGRVFIGPELATLHHICVSHLPELQNMSKINNSIKKLVTVTEMLSKHKLKYLEMIS